MKLDRNGALLWESGGNVETCGCYPQGRGHYCDEGSIISDAKPIDDGGVIVAGLTTDAWIEKFSAMGTSQWKLRYGGFHSDSVNSISPLSDGGYLAAGTTDSFNDANLKAWVLRVNSEGRPKGTCLEGIGDKVASWSNIYRDEFENCHFSVEPSSLAVEDLQIQSYDATVVIASQCGTPNDDFPRFYDFGVTDSEPSVVTLSDGGYLMIAACKNPGDGINVSCLARFDAKGTIVWVKAYPDTGVITGVNEREDGDLAAISFSSNGGTSAIFWLALGANGNVHFIKSYDYTCPLNQLSTSIFPDGGALLTASGQPHCSGLIKIDPLGNVEWAKNYHDYAHLSVVRQSEGLFGVLAEDAFFKRHVLFTLDTAGKTRHAVELSTGDSLVWLQGMVSANATGFILFGTGQEEPQLPVAMTNGFGTKAFAIKLNGDLALEWSKKYSWRNNMGESLSFGLKMAPYSSNGFLASVTLETLEYNDEAYQYYISTPLTDTIAQIDDSGTVVRARMFGDVNYLMEWTGSEKRLTDIHALKDGGVIAAGRGYWVVKLTPDWTVKGNCPNYIGEPTHLESTDIPATVNEATIEGIAFAVPTGVVMSSVVDITGRSATQCLQP